MLLKKLLEKDLDEACRLMGTADVPVAVALSGGIDSSLVAAVIKIVIKGPSRFYHWLYWQAPYSMKEKMQRN